MKAKSVRAKKYVVLLSNRVDRRDDESFVIWAKSYQEAENKAKQKGWDTMQFSLRGIYLKSEL